MKYYTKYCDRCHDKCNINYSNKLDILNCENKCNYRCLYGSGFEHFSNNNNRKIYTVIIFLLIWFIYCNK
jgi:hypothetical protein